MAKAKKKNLVIVIAMIAVLAIGSISAYFTATDSQTNTFTVGNVQIEQWENDGTTDIQSGGITDGNVIPNKETVKKPFVKNTGNNDAYIFTAVAVPKKMVKVARTTDANPNEAGEGPAIGADGNSNPAVDGDAVMTQLFQLNGTNNGTTALSSLKKDTSPSLEGQTSHYVTSGTTATYDIEGAAIPVFTNSVNSIANTWTGNDSWTDSWKLVDVNGVNSTYDAGNPFLFKDTAAHTGNANTGTDTANVNFADHYNVYIFAYVDSTNGELKALASNATTPEVFQSVTFANVVNINDVIASGSDNSMDYDSGLEGKVPQILVKSYAIQSSNIENNDSSTKDARKVWDILNNQDGAYRALTDQLADLNRDWWSDPDDPNYTGAHAAGNPVDGTDRNVATP
jgi:predicted ribosomally synthesized peptide with SipW-like signal peptide